MEQKDVNKKYTLADIESTLKLKTWWAAICILPFSRRIALFLCNRTDIRPNTVTLISFILRIVSAFCFLRGGYPMLILGALIFEFAYVLDCVDGSIARLKEYTSTIGAFYDHATDTMGVTINFLAIGYTAGVLNSSLFLGVIIIYLYLHFITFVAESIFVKEKYRIGLEKSDEVLDKEVIKDAKGTTSLVSRIVVKYRSFFSTKRFKAFISPPDVEAVVCFIFPVLNKPQTGFVWALWMLSFILVYKLFCYVYILLLKAGVNNDEV
ncbi:MAG: CDP-alcohol phosphatidyltransferase family protein [Candidatus Omnitrophica bacterium]|nr:CDP-alcohol phosphatidyltransferase family protein [Candidatus Omnitrophota bacterium]